MKDPQFEALHTDGRKSWFTERSFELIGGEAKGWKRLTVVPDEVQAALAGNQDLGQTGETVNGHLIDEGNAKLAEAQLEIETLKHFIAGQNTEANKATELAALQTQVIAELEKQIASRNEVIEKLEGGEELKRAKIEALENEIEALKNQPAKPASTPKKK